MRFIVFYNDHPLVEDYNVRVWDNAKVHPNFKGEMTHSDFIRHYKLNVKNVSSVGYVSYNSATNVWEEDKSKPAIFLRDKNERVGQDIQLVLDYMHKNHGNDEEAKRNSLTEQWQVRQIQLSRGARSA